MRGNETTANSFGRNKQGQLAKDIDKFLTKHHLWGDCHIYVNGKRFSRDVKTDDELNVISSKLYVEEDMDPRDYFEWVGDKFLCMSFEGPLYNILNYYDDFVPGYDERMIEELEKVLEKHGKFYELGNAWNLAVHSI